MAGVAARPDDRSDDCANSARPAHAVAVLDELRRYFGVQFSLWEANAGRLLFRGNDQPAGDESLFSALVPAVGRAARPQFLGHEDYVVVLAIPLPGQGSPDHVAIAAFATDHAPGGRRIAASARLLGLDPSQAREWINRQSHWSPEALLRLANAVQDKLAIEDVEADGGRSHAAFHWIVRGKCAIGAHEFSRLVLADVVRAMSSAIDAKDPYTCGHSDRVARFSVRLARQLGWPRERLTDIYMAGLLHDIGKIGIDERLLRKPEPLTDGEYERIKLHPLLGYRMLTGIDQLAAVLPAVLYHHEQWDGRGYPEGLATEKIPELARIIAVADAHDAMISDRPYRAGMPLDAVQRVVLEGAAVFWDPRVVRAYFHLQREAVPRPGEPTGLPIDIPEWH